MTTISSVASTPESGLKAFANRHPLTAYFTLDRNSGASPGSYSDLVTVSLIF